jgi:metal-dependent amidase/aminoacylase/carboxypeptidase family protein
MAASDSAEVVFYGRGGQGSRPEATIDPVLMAASVVTRLQGIVAREVPPAQAAVVTVGRLQAGTKDNIIPDTAEQGEATVSGAPRPPALTWTASEDVGVFGEASRAPTVYWFWGGLDAQTAAAALRDGRLDSLPGNHSPHFAPVIEPTLTWLGTPGIRHTGTGGGLCRAISSNGKSSR